MAARVLWLLCIHSVLATIGASDNASEACIDDDALLRHTIVTYIPRFPPSAVLLVSCSLLGQTIKDPDSYNARWFSDQLAEYGIPPVNCSTKLKEFCFATGDYGVDCHQLGEDSIESTCCEACHGSQQEQDTWHFGSQGWHEEAEYFVEFVTKLDIYLPKAVREAKDLCQWERVFCLPTHYEFFARYNSYNNNNNNNALAFSPVVGKLAHATKIFLNGVQISGPIPQELGDCAMLQELTIRASKLTGSLPSSLAKLANLVLLEIVENPFLGGRLAPDLFRSMPRIVTIKLDSNRFEGEFPVLDLTSSPQLSTISAANNRFIGMTGLIQCDADSCARQAGIDISFADNKFSSIPTVLRSFPKLLTLNLSHNSITDLPPWGDYNADADIRVFSEGIDGQQGQVELCLWRAAGRPELAPPQWPSLRAVNLDSNPLKTDVKRFITVFANAPSLGKLTCNSCALFGTLSTDSRTTSYPTLKRNEYKFMVLRYDELDDIPPSGQDCELKAAYTSLAVLQLHNNSEIEGCDFIEASRSTGNSSQFSFNCGSCLPEHRGSAHIEGFGIPDDALTPLLSKKDCSCNEGFEEYVGEECGCPDFTYFDGTSCTACPDAFDCYWGGDAKKSLQAFIVKPGYWVPGLPRNGSFEAELYACAPGTCIGGQMTYDSTTSPLCVSGRAGRACSLCLNRHYPNPDGTDGRCVKCTTSIDNVLAHYLALSAVLVLGLFIAMLLMGTDETAAAEQRESEVRASEQDPAAKPSLRDRAMLWYYDSAPTIVRLKIMVILMFKYVQIIAVIGLSNINRSSSSQSTFAYMRQFGVNPDAVIQVQCLNAEQSIELHMITKWVFPLGIMVLCILAVLLSIPLAKVPCKFADSFRVGKMKAATFVYQLWKALLPSLMRNCFEIFTCISHPNGKSTVLSHRSLDCNGARWWSLFAGGLIASCVYIVLFFVFSVFAIRAIVKTLRETDLKHRGPFKFIVEGLHDSRVDFPVRSALRDVSQNLIVAVFASEPLTSALVAACVFAYFAKMVYDLEPYEDTTLNVMEIGFSTLVSALLITSATLSGAVDADEVDHSREAIFMAILMSSMLFPVAIFTYEIATMVPALRKLVPKSCLPYSREIVEKQKQLLKKMDASVAESLDSANISEWRRLVKVLFGSAGGFEAVVCQEGDKNSKGKMQWPPPDIATVIGRQDLHARHASMAMSSHCSADSNAGGQASASSRTSEQVDDDTDDIEVQASKGNDVSTSQAATSECPVVGIGAVDAEAVTASITTTRS